MKKNTKSITLIGMPTSGKSTIGKLLADKLGWDFIDLDDLIKEKTGKSYDEILEKDGEKKLLNLENQYTLELDFSAESGSASGGEGSGIIFSPGGSLIYSVEAMEKVAKETKIIYIELPLKEIEIRLGLRPVKGGIVGLKEKGLKKLFEERDAAYRKFADFIIKADNLSEEELVIKILELINQ